MKFGLLYLEECYPERELARNDEMEVPPAEWLMSILIK